MCRGLKKELNTESARLATTCKIYRKELNHIAKKGGVNHKTASDHMTGSNRIGKMKFTKKTGRR